MSMTMYPDPAAQQGLPMAPGGLGPPPPLDASNAGPMPGEEGLAGLMAALQGGQAGGPPPELGGLGIPPELGGQEPLPEEELAGADEEEPLDSVGHIQQAMKHLMMALASEPDEERGHGIAKGMGALQGILAGEQKKNAQLSQLGG
jgi:hypothetical protein